MTRMFEPTSPFLDAPADESSIVRAVEELPGRGHRHAIVRLGDQTLALSTAYALDPDAEWPRFATAASQRAGLSSDRLLPLVASGNCDGRFYVVYEIRRAVPLATYRDAGELTTQRCLAFLLGISRALDDATSEGKPPYAVTPESVFIEPRRGAVIADLGVAREALGNPPPTEDPDAPWIAPEVLEDERVHPRSGVYSFGAIAYTLLTGQPPDSGPPSALRPDLPEALDEVLSVALAREPRKRYGTAAEVRHLVNLVIYGAPPHHDEPRVSRFPKRAPVPPAPAREAPARPQRRWRLAPALLLAGALVAGAVTGTVVAGGGDDSPGTPERLAGEGLSLTLPKGWERSPGGDAALAAHSDDRPGTVLTVALVDAPVTAEEQEGPVKLGALEAWRTRGPAEAGKGTEVRYVIPTRDGKVEVTCAAPADLLAICERAASTLRLGSVTAVPLATVVEQAERWTLVAGRLRVDRRAALRRLAGARLPAGQSMVADALAQVHERAARRFAALPGGEAAAAAARRTAAAYGALAAAARRGDSGRWNAARAQVREREAELADAVASG